MERLQNAGVAAGAVISGLEVLSDSHLAAREFMLTVDKVEAGTHLYPGFAPRFHPDASQLRMPPPCFGEHNAMCLARCLVYR